MTAGATGAVPYADLSRTPSDAFLRQNPALGTSLPEPSCRAPAPARGGEGCSPGPPPTFATDPRPPPTPPPVRGWQEPSQAPTESEAQSL